MFHDRYGLTEAVLSGRKTQTRRIAYDFRKHASNKVDKCVLLGNNNLTYKDGDVQVLDELRSPQYRVGEVIAVAQSYKDCGFDPETPLMEANGIGGYVKTWFSPGWTNKMFVRADLMPHHIRFTNVRVERLQDISDEDCIKEGIYLDVDPMNPQAYIFTYPNAPQWYYSAREAYAALIDRISGKDTWESNPYVFVYDFELVK